MISAFGLVFTLTFNLNDIAQMRAMQDAGNKASIEAMLVEVDMRQYESGAPAWSTAEGLSGTPSLSRRSMPATMGSPSPRVRRAARSWRASLVVPSARRMLAWSRLTSASMTAMPRARWSGLPSSRARDLAARLGPSPIEDSENALAVRRSAAVSVRFLSHPAGLGSVRLLSACVATAPPG